MTAIRFDLTLDLGFNLITHKKTRIDGIDTPELRGGTDQSKALAKHAKMVASQWVKHAMEQGGAYFSSQRDTRANSGDRLAILSIQKRGR